MLEINIEKILDKKKNDINSLKKARKDIENKLIENGQLSKKIVSTIIEYKKILQGIDLGNNNIKYLINSMQQLLSMKNFLQSNLGNINKNVLKELLSQEENILYLKEKAKIGSDGEILNDTIIKSKIRMQLAGLKVFYAYIQDFQLEVSNLIGSITDTNIFLINKLKILQNELLESKITK